MDSMHEALYYQMQPSLALQCLLCPHHCHIRQDETGFCGVRYNKNGKLVAKSYGQLTAIQIDPIEKKPLAHFMPHTQTYSVGSYGCNLRCPFCQNSMISMGRPPVTVVSPEKTVQDAIAANCPSISFTYNEALIGYEYVLDTAKIAKDQGLKTVIVTNGMIEQAPLTALLPYIDAMNIDIKTFEKQKYKSVLQGCLESVKRTVLLAAQSVHVEIAALIVTGLNDNEQEMEALCQWLSSIQSKEKITVHLNRYFPAYNYHEPPTDLNTLKNMQKIAQKYLEQVYIGNV